MLSLTSLANLPLLVGALLSISVPTFGAAYTATYLPSNVPKTTEDGQTGTNQCGNVNNQESMCQNSYINAVDDFCLWAPPSTESMFGSSAIGNTEAIEVSWCLRTGYGTRTIPPSALRAVHWVQTPDYVQVTGMGDLTQLNIPKGDEGGELDPHGATGLGNPVGGLVFGDAFGGILRQYHEWTNFMAADQFCFRACLDGTKAPHLCNHIYDVMGCEWNMPGDYSDGITSCEGDSTEPMGIYGTSTFHQGDAATPPPHTPGATSNCQTLPLFTTNLAATLSLASVSISFSTPSTTSGSTTGSTSIPTTTIGGTNSASGSHSTTSSSSPPAKTGAASRGASSMKGEVLIGMMVVGGVMLAL